VGLAWKCRVAPDGTLNLGQYGIIHVAGLANDQACAAICARMGLAVPRVPGPAPGAAAEPAGLIKPHDVLAWHVDLHRGPSPRTISGKGQVKPDGTFDLGVYGTVRIGGLGAGPARGVIEKQVVAYLTGCDRGSLAPASARAAKGPIIPASLQLVQGPADPPRAPRGAIAQPMPVGPAHPTKGVFNPSTPDLSNPREVPGDPPAAAPGAATDAEPPSLPAPRPVEAGGPPVPPPYPLSHPTPRECGLNLLPPYIIAPPDILLVESTQQLRDQPVRGQHLVRPDGTMGLGIYGSVSVAGLTLEQARSAIAAQLSLRIKDLDINNLSVDVLAYNSKVYYVITDGGGYGEQVYRIPVTGNETVLDAISLVNGLPPVASRSRVWLARPCCAGYRNHLVLPVDWVGITQAGIPDTNYQVFPGDRIYVKADPWITFDAGVAKVLAPFERMLGITLLGAETVNAIRNRSGTGSGTGF
jgi:polysaccharide export outer membrane protein